MYITEMRSDVALKNELVNFLTMATANASELGLDAPEIEALGDAIAAFDTGMNAVTSQKAILKSTVTGKNGAAADIREIVAGYAQMWRGNSTVSDETLNKLNVPPHNTPATHTPATTPTGLEYSMKSPNEIVLKWNRNGNKSGTVFNVQTSSTGAGDWSVVKTTTKTKTEIIGTPGQPLYIQVFAVRSNSTSSPSGSINIWVDGEENGLQIAA